MSVKQIGYFLIVSFLLLYACKSSESLPKKEPVLLTVGKSPVFISEFKYLYQKNINNTDSLYTQQSIQDYLDLFVNFKLKIADAVSQGIDTIEAFKREFATYEEQLAQPYLIDQTATDELAKEAYERMKEEVNASHILVKVGEEADPEDTLKAFKKITEVREKALKGEDFEQLALQYSEDGSVGSTKGKLGYFTALQMVYPFENAAYNTPVGQVSPIVRSQYGYHILKINHRRPASGRVTVAHIMVQISRKASEDEIQTSKKKIEEIYQALLKGENWDKLCQQFSDDATSKNQGGKLPEFKIGETLPELEEAAFNLQNLYDISKPFQTAFGWHILKLLNKKPLAPYKELEVSIKQDITKDSRNKLSRRSLIERIKTESNFTEIADALPLALEKADSRLLKGAWSYNSTEAVTKLKMFSLKNKETKLQKAYSVKDFFDFLYEKQVPRPDLKDAKYYMLIYYAKFKESTLLEFERKNLPLKYADFKMLLNEYREGMMIFQMMNDKVWEKGIQDTTGCRQYFLKNREKYKWGQRANAVLYKVVNESLINELKPYLLKNLYPVSKFKTENLSFDKEDISLDEQSLATINQIAELMQKNPHLKIEINGHTDPAENKKLAEQRIQAVVKYLTFKKIDITRIITKDFGGTKPVSNTDRAKNRRIEFAYFSTAKADLENLFNQSNPLNLKITEGIFQKGDNEFLDKTDWKPGVYTVKEKNQVFYIEILDIKEPRLKEYEEARGFVITDYQKSLEQQWLSSLKEQFPVEINQAELQKLIKK